jgi:hypothetical protein
VVRPGGGGGVLPSSEAEFHPRGALGPTVSWTAGVAWAVGSFPVLGRDLCEV